MTTKNEAATSGSSQNETTSTSDSKPARLLLTEKEVAERQGRAVKTLQNQRVHGAGIPFLKLGRTVRYRLADIEAWEAACTRRSTSDRGLSR